MTEILFADAVPVQRDNGVEKADWINISVKMSKERTLQLQLTSESDYTFLYSLDINTIDFSKLKTEQNLLVEFVSFPLKFIELLKQVVLDSNLESPKFICKLVSRDPNPATLSVIETNSFRNIIHISLSFVPGNDTQLKSYLAGLVKEFKDKSTSLSDKLLSKTQTLDAKELDYKDLIQKLTLELENTRIKANENRQSLELDYNRQITKQREDWLKEKEESRLQAENLQRNLELKSKDQIDGLLEKISNLKEYSGNTSEKILHLQNSLEISERDRNRINLDLVSTKRDLERVSYSLEENTRIKGGLEASNERLLSHIQQLEKRERELSDSCRGNDDRILGFQEKITRLEEEVSYHKSQFLKMEDNVKRASDEINKGNDIIRKLQTDLKSAKSKIKLKNTVTIAQEKLLEEKLESVGTLQKEILDCKESLEKLKTENQALASKNGEYEKKLEESKSIINDNNHVIEWLHKQLNEDALTRPYSHSVAPVVDFSKYTTSNLAHVDVKRQSPPRFNRHSPASENRPPSNGSVYKGHVTTGQHERSNAQGVVASSPLPPNSYRGVNHLDGSIFSNPATANMGQTNFDTGLKNTLKPSVGIKSNYF